MTSCDVLILGAGASGLMCAATAAERKKKVVVLDHTTLPARKVLASGGGRCNFTNLDTHLSHYVTANPHFVREALKRYAPKDFIHLLKRRGIQFREKKDGQLFCETGAKKIVQMLVERAIEGGVDLRNGVVLQDVAFAEGRFTVTTDGEAFEALRLVVATGGLSYPALGASDLGYRLAGQFGHEVVPPSPGLVGLTFNEKDQERFKGLEGIHLRVGLSVRGRELEDDLMLTHTGLSGPVILDASLIWDPGERLVINWVPGHGVETTYEQLMKDKKKGGKGIVKPWFLEAVPKRLAERLAWHAGARGNWTALSEDVLWALANAIHADSLVPAETAGYDKAEVTRGGVDTHQINPTTMESRKRPGLFFAGEVLDVTGRLGGFNLQWAWTSGFIAGQSV